MGWPGPLTVNSNRFDNDLPSAGANGTLGLAHVSVAGSTISYVSGGSGRDLDLPSECCWVSRDAAPSSPFLRYREGMVAKSPIAKWDLLAKTGARTKTRTAHHESPVGRGSWPSAAMAQPPRPPSPRSSASPGAPGRR